MATDGFGADFDHAQASDEPAFTVDLDGFEGPLDLLLELARRQRVDLARISILALVDQYLRFVEAARKLRLELAADYLVMAAWLAFLKSRLLLPAAAEPAGVLCDVVAQRPHICRDHRHAKEQKPSDGITQNPAHFPRRDGEQPVPQRRHERRSPQSV